MDWKSTRRYYTLYWKTFGELWRLGLDWKGYTVEILSALVGGWLFVRTNGWNAVVSNVSDFLLSIFVLPVVLAVSYSMYQCVMTPVVLYIRKENLAWRRTWHDVEIISINFSDEAWFGVGLSIISDKADEFVITNFYPKVKKILHGKEVIYESNIPNVGIELKLIEQKSKTGSFYPRLDALHIPSRKTEGESTVAIHVAKFDSYQSLAGKIENGALIEGVIEMEGKEPQPVMRQVELPCKIEIVLGGLVDSLDTMDVCQIVCEIQESENRGLEMTMTRIPEYEYR